MPTLDDFIRDFDAKQKDFHGIAVAKGVIGEIEAALGRFLEEVYPTIEPYVNAGINLAAIALGSAAGPLAPLVSYVATAFGRTGVHFLVAWLEKKLAAKANPTT